MTVLIPAPRIPKIKRDTKRRSDAGKTFRNGTTINDAREERGRGEATECVCNARRLTWAVQRDLKACGERVLLKLTSQVWLTALLQPLTECRERFVSGDVRGLLHSVDLEDLVAK